MYLKGGIFIYTFRKYLTHVTQVTQYDLCV